MLDNNQKRGSITLSGRCIWEDRFPLWGQLNYTIRDKDGMTSTFTSIVWLKDNWHAHIMRPYLCYSGGDEPTYEQLSAMDTGRIFWIATRTTAKHFVYWQFPKIVNRTIYNIGHIIKAPYRAYQAYQGKKAMDKMFN